MGVRIDEARNERATLAIDNVVGSLLARAAGLDRRDETIVDAHPADVWRRGLRRHNKNVADQARGHRVASASSPRVTLRSKWPNKVKEATPSAASTTIETNNKSVRSCVAEVMTR